MPAYLREEMGESRCITSGVWCKGILHSQIRQQAVLDHQEFLGQEMGRKWLLPSLQWAWYVWNEHNGLGSGYSSFLSTTLFLFTSSSASLLLIGRLGISINIFYCI